MTLSEQLEQAWQNFLKDNPSLDTTFNRTVFEHAFYAGAIAEQPKTRKAA